MKNGLKEGVSMNKVRRGDVFRMLDRDCINSQSAEVIKEYINRLLRQIPNSEVK